MIWLQIFVGLVIGTIIGIIWDLYKKKNDIKNIRQFICLKTGGHCWKPYMKDNPNFPDQKLRKCTRCARIEVRYKGSNWFQAWLWLKIKNV